MVKKVATWWVNTKRDNCLLDATVMNIESGTTNTFMGDIWIKMS